MDSQPSKKPLEDEQFWTEFRDLLLSLVCLVERKKIDGCVTTSELRRAGKKVLVDVKDRE